MPWQNVTVFVPPANDSLVAELLQEAYANGCWFEPKNCPRVRPYLHHHVVEKSSFPAGKKVKTMAGNRIWWTTVGEEKYLMPNGIKVREIEEAQNGERWHVERSLDY